MTGFFTAAGLDRFAEVAAGQVGADKVPGLVAAIARGGRTHVEVHGRGTIGGAPVNRDSLFRIASTTKPITAAATMALIDEGLIDLDSPVDRWVPEMAAPRVLRRMDGPLDDTVAADRPITVRDLLTFTFGFGMSVEMFAADAPWPVVVAAGDLHLGALGPPAPAGPPDPDTWIKAMGSLPLMDQPGRRWLYNTGAQVLGVLLSRLAGQPFEEVLRSRVFGPLAMDHTAFHAPDPDRLATAYVPTPAGLQAWDPPDGQWARPPAFCDGAAGLVSTVDDLIAFGRMMAGQGPAVLSVGARKAMSRDQLDAGQRAGTRGFLDEDRSWGLGQSVVTGGPRSGAFGWDGGLGTSWLVDQERDLIVVVLTQRMFDGPALPQAHRDLQAAAYSALG